MYVFSGGRFSGNKLARPALLCAGRHLQDKGHLEKSVLGPFANVFVRTPRGVDWEKLSSARLALALAKVPLVAGFVRETLEAGAGKIVIFAHHREMIHRLKEALQFAGPVLLYGGMTPFKRQAAIDSFFSQRSLPPVGSLRRRRFANGTFLVVLERTPTRYLIVASTCLDFVDSSSQFDS
jgi:hypothetical protein